MNEVAPKVLITDQPSSDLSVLLGKMNYSRLALIVDDQTEQYCLPVIKDIPEGTLIISIASGEINKNLNTCTLVWQKLTEANFDRNSLVINLGGGVVGDLGGFCAATYKRGIRFLNMPTTLLSQVDASVGGKLGIDFLNYKNQIGVFTEPEYILIYPGFLNTLPHRELVSGYAEVVKHSLIQDNALWEKLNKSNVEAAKSGDLISEAVRIKYNVVRQDFQELGIRKLLNFGHTIGHAIESYLMNDVSRRILHGEAIGAGMLMEAFISFTKGNLKAPDLEEIQDFILKTFPYIRLNTKELPDITKYLYQDKKNINGKLKFTLLESIGKGIYDIEVTEKECLNAFNYYINFVD